MERIGWRPLWGLSGGIAEAYSLTETPSERQRQGLVTLVLELRWALSGSGRQNSGRLIMIPGHHSLLLSWERITLSQAFDTRGAPGKSIEMLLVLHWLETSALRRKSPGTSFEVP